MESMSDRLSGLAVEDFNGIGAGSTVWFLTPQKQERSGRVVMSFPTHLVLNCGGSHGTPAVVNNKNYLRHRSCKK